ncbi:cyclin-dependent kinase inhibitor 1 [Macrosteles quadrilineatus]|uniref:cyclin-dependent kinase inhibitor 1 n=1 Tax=Macrosteles quadrilineatus TaxID=74068 RepID=UPI0023E0F10A|nr:cyclin-dependent kinase inhibitor 1 [Macrosteles quadrilineatus]
MSARVFNPLVMSEMRRMIGRSNSDVGPNPAAIARVRRGLFGPVNHEEAQSFVDKELAAMRQLKTDRWGFDFVKEAPLENSRLRWERVTPEENIPEAYALRRLSFLGQQTEAATVRSRDVSTSTTATTTSSSSAQDTAQRTKPANKQTQLTDFMKCRKRSFSAGDISSRKVGSASLGDISSSKVGTTSESSKRKRSKTRQ